MGSTAGCTFSCWSRRWIDLLRTDGLEPSKANIAQYGGYLFSIFMLGWACAMFWGWLADRNWPGLR